MDTNWQVEIFTILTHPSEACIYLWLTDAGVVLPSVRLQARNPWVNLETIKTPLQESLGSTVNILRIASYHEDKAAQQVALIYIIERRRQCWRLAGAGSGAQNSLIYH